MANEEHDESRRKFLKNSGYAAGGFVGGGLLFGLIDNPFKSSDEDATKNDQAERKFEESRMFFTRYKDFQVLEHATERIFPEDDNGPGAIKLGVPYFIDKQLAGDFGSNKKDYMQGPVHRLKDREESIDTYQSLMNRGQVFIEGLRKINAESEKRHDENFYDLEGDQQDTILEELENDEIKIEGVRSRTFFNLLKKMTIEGAYSDPLYGGNKNMEGWKMTEFPGVRASYTDLIESDEFQKLEPMSLKDYQQ